jgi:hypothetical protein
MRSDCGLEHVTKSPADLIRCFSDVCIIATTGDIAEPDDLSVTARHFARDGAEARVTSIRVLSIDLKTIGQFIASDGLVGDEWCPPILS